MSAIFLVFDTLDKILASVKVINLLIFIMLYYLFRKPDRSAKSAVTLAFGSVATIYGIAAKIAENPHYIMKTVLIIVVAFLVTANIFIITALIIGVFNDLVIRRKRGHWFITTLILLAILYLEIVRVYGIK